MALFLTVHTFPSGSFRLDQVSEMARMGQQDSMVRGHYSTGSLLEGKAVCRFEVPTKTDWFGKLGMPFEMIVEAEREGDRGDIRPL